MSREYRVFVQDPGMADPLSQRVGIYIWREHDRAILQPDGAWAPAPEGASVPPSIFLPREAMEALINAIDAYRGQPSHAKTEAAVLREWLAKEQSRVDKVFEAVGRPIVFEGPSR